MSGHLSNSYQNYFVIPVLWHKANSKMQLQIVSSFRKEQFFTYSNENCHILEIIEIFYFDR